MKISTNKQPASHSNLMFWGEAACNKRDLSFAIGRYDEKSDSLLLAGTDDLTKKISKLIDIGVQFKPTKHKNGNWYLSDTFGSPTSTSINELQDDPNIMKEALNELTEPEFKSGALSFTDFKKSLESNPEQPEKKAQDIKPKKADKRKSLSETESELIQLMRDRSSNDLINATLKELEESYDPYATDI